MCNSTCETILIGTVFFKASQLQLVQFNCSVLWDAGDCAKGIYGV